ncbi:hypothetical protein PRZ48_008605 [Zasmidium cellare]|uniref:Uncharacterized protein n=1 Tax=Zasmidium cellare TaxID=395010 RepID=A0ABR0EFX8_ZASCE|nr:hypothetical protein PRZ48_008605 [Zasmidium cellare]
MKVFSLILNALLAGTVSAGWIYPAKYWKSVSQTLPGATYRKRSVPPPPSRLLERGGGNLYQACSTANLASKYNKYPINGLAVGGATIAVINDNSGFGNDIIDTSYSSASSAYDCCVQAQGMPDSAVFYYSSSQDPGFRCLIVTTSTSTVIFGATYNGSEPRGTVYGNCKQNSSNRPSAASTDLEL